MTPIEEIMRGLDNLIRVEKVGCVGTSVLYFSLLLGMGGISEDFLLSL